MLNGSAELAVDNPGPDDVLVDRARDDVREFAPLYERYLDPVFRYCYRRLGSRQAAEDATSTAFMRVLDRLATYRGGSFRAWLFTIVHHVVVDTLRNRRPGVSIDGLERVADPSPSPEEATVALDVSMTVRNMLQHLSADQRQVVELHLAGLTGPEIAAVTGRSHDAVRAIQSRAVARLRCCGRPPLVEQGSHEAR